MPTVPACCRLSSICPAVTCAGPLVLACAVIQLAASWKSAAEETAPPAPAAGRIAESNMLQITSVFLQLHDQVRATRQAIEQNRQETRQAAALTAESLSNALQIVQASFAVQRARDLEAIQETNTVILRVAGAFAAVGFLALLTIGYLQWRLSQGLIEISAVLPAGLALADRPTPATPGPAATPDPALPESIERQEKRIADLAQARRPASKPRKRFGRSIERWLFPRPGDSLRRRQFRALRTALMFGMVCAGVVALVLYLVYKQPRL